MKKVLKWSLIIVLGVFLSPVSVNADEALPYPLGIVVEVETEDSEIDYVIDILVLKDELVNPNTIPYTSHPEIIRNGDYNSLDNDWISLRLFGKDGSWSTNSNNLTFDEMGMDIPELGFYRFKVIVYDMTTSEVFISDIYNVDMLATYVEPEGFKIVFNQDTEEFTPVLYKATTRGMDGDSNDLGFVGIVAFVILLPTLFFVGLEALLMYLNKARGVTFGITMGFNFIVLLIIMIPHISGIFEMGGAGVLATIVYTTFLYFLKVGLVYRFDKESGMLCAVTSGIYGIVIILGYTFLYLI